MVFLARPEDHASHSQGCHLPAEERLLSKRPDWIAPGSDGGTFPIVVEETFLSSPLGTCKIVANENGVCSIRFMDDDNSSSHPDKPVANLHLLKASEELESYFAGKLTVFTCTLAPEGTGFQKRVWDRLSAIRFGASKSYGEIAAEIGQANAARAVGGANNRNPIPIIIPCHRVIGSRNALVGFACGVWRKQWMLEHEGITLPLG